MKIEPNPRFHFASDNIAGICPEAFAALTEANQGSSPNYGNDPWTQKASDLIRDLFETKCEVFFVFNGTAANSLSLAALCQSYHSVLCHEHAHVETAECSAPEFFSGGSKVLLVPGADSKIDSAAIERIVKKRTDFHYPKPRVISITQATEAGTVYSMEELRRVTDEARKFGLRIHMDGARFANAVAALNVKPGEMTWKLGVDVLSFGGTKNGMAVGETVVFFDLDLAREFEYRCKQAGQLASKMRFLSASWVGVLENGAWLHHARHANEMAKRLEKALTSLGLKMAHPCDTNGVFIFMPPKLVAGLRERGWKFFPHVTPDNIRLMCSWDTTQADIDALVADVKNLIG